MLLNKWQALSFLIRGKGKFAFIKGTFLTVKNFGCLTPAFFKQRVIFFFFCFVFLVSDAFAIPYSILVDKKKNQLFICEYLQGGFNILKTFHVTLGRVKGDKEDEDDLKTPEGIYLFKSILAPPDLQRRFGIMAIAIDFPNPFDVLAGRTGSGIMLHATDEPDRLQKNYDSQGCIVVNNKEILEIRSYIEIGSTPVLIFSEISEEYFHPDHDGRVAHFFQKWILDWESKNIEEYILNYHESFSAQGKDRSFWKIYKEKLNSIYAIIKVSPENVLIYRHPKYSMVTFDQNYVSLLKNNRFGHRSIGVKTLYIAEENGELKIISETFKKKK